MTNKMDKEFRAHKVYNSLSTIRVDEIIVAYREVDDVQIRTGLSYHDYTGGVPSEDGFVVYRNDRPAVRMFDFLYRICQEIAAGHMTNVVKMTTMGAEHIVDPEKVIQFVKDFSNEA